MEELKKRLSAVLADAVDRASREQGWPPVSMPEIAWEYPPEPTFGDLSTTVSFALAKQVRRSPRDVATAIQRAVNPDPALVEKIEVAGPGYLNIFVANGWWHAVIRKILEEGAAYGRATVGQGSAGPGGVRERQPDGPPARGTRAGRRPGRCHRQPTPGGGLSRRARVLHQRRRKPDAPLGGIGLGAASGGLREAGPVPRERLPRRVHPGTGGAGGRGRPRSRRARGGPGDIHLHRAGVPHPPGGDRGGPPRLRRGLRLVGLGAEPVRIRRGGGGPGHAPRRGLPLRGGEGGRVPRQRLRGREGSHPDPEQRRAHVRHLGHRLPRQQDPPRLRLGSSTSGGRITGATSRG